MRRGKLAGTAVLLACVACSTPPVFVTAPQDGDIRPADDYNVFLKDAAAQANLPLGRAARSIEIVFRAPIVLAGIEDYLANDGIVVQDSRFEDEQSIFNYVDTGDLGEDTAPVSFSRALVPRAANEGQCDLVAATDTSCDVMVLHIAEGAIPAGTEVVFVISGNLDGYRVDENGVPDPQNIFTLGNERTVMLTVEQPTGDALVLESYTLRLPEEGGDFEGLFEPGVCTLCDTPPENTILQLPQVEFYIPPHGEIRGRFNEPPARFSLFADAGEEGFTPFFPGSQVRAPDGTPFEIGVDSEFVIDGPLEPGAKVHSFAVASDDLFVQLGTPNRFFLPPPTQTEAGDGFVQSVGTNGKDPTSDIQHFTIAHVRIKGASEGGIDDRVVFTIDENTPSLVTLPLETVVDADTPRRTVDDVKLFVRDADDIGGPRVPVLAAFNSQDQTIAFNPRDLGLGRRILFATAFNSAGGPLGSDFVRVALTEPFVRRGGGAACRPGEFGSTNDIVVSDEGIDSTAEQQFTTIFCEVRDVGSSLILDEIGVHVFDQNGQHPVFFRAVIRTEFGGTFFTDFGQTTSCSIVGGVPTTNCGYKTGSLAIDQSFAGVISLTVTAQVFGIGHGIPNAKTHRILGWFARGRRGFVFEL